MEKQKIKKLKSQSRNNRFKKIGLAQSVFKGIGILIVVIFGSVEIAKGQNVLRVGTSGDYAPFSMKISDHINEYEGFDITLAKLYAEEKGLDIEWVPFRWSELTDDFKNGKFDIVMSGVTVTPERSITGQFTVPVTTEGAVVLVKASDSFDSIESLDKKEVSLAVNAGGYLEKVGRQQFKKAQIFTKEINYDVRTALLEGKVNGAITDIQEAPEWLKSTKGLVILGPFTEDWKAYWVSPERPNLAADFNKWLMKLEKEGMLADLRSKYLGETGGLHTAMPLKALIAAVQERLSLMPIIGEIKHAKGIPFKVPEREKQVLQNSWTKVQEAAREHKINPPSEDAVKRFFQCQMDLAKAVERNVAYTKNSFSEERSLPDLKKDLRPALDRIGVKITQLIVLLPKDLSFDQVRKQVIESFKGKNLEKEQLEKIAKAIMNLSEGK
ncbi:transporter substrate-binding domain-containing protein [Xanthovirga aplysinae]|uniref:transporter substrate-binding domain-containing protein n=1 Tax=Xanthovirga aplysinae TaxID=2529853 RepID=UPI0012BC5F14|nr:transporter substrate-binding domain-containing protein [Xanthovirga aplysinae]MTI32154.1 transporter substrate-binding domain-containing protein [Xanthovirga aplysinae]